MTQFGPPLVLVLSGVGTTLVQYLQPIQEGAIFLPVEMAQSKGRIGTERASNKRAEPPRQSDQAQTTVVLPLPDPTAGSGSAGLWNMLKLDAKGDLTMNGESAESGSDGLRRIARRNAKGTRLFPDGSSLYGDVVSAIIRAQQITPASVRLEGNMAYRSFASSVTRPPNRNEIDALLSKPAFIVLAGTSNDRRVCQITIRGANGSPLAVSSQELVELSYDHLDAQVKRAGGFDNYDMAKAEATIRAARYTPWRCVAGAVYNLQVSGRTAIRFELI